jgi:hypothetical protein
MAPLPQPSDIEGVLEDIKKKLIEIWPAKGCPDFGTILLRVVFQDRCAVRIEGQLESATDKRKNSGKS